MLLLFVMILTTELLESLLRKLHIDSKSRLLLFLIQKRVPLEA
jgi:hypothetical protein